ncbi:hypothetical protein F4677DRAFT_399534 [Hypoxylon crocopeplum]|nr:hypothetical protein F4677DRAFT_399534 [Hypoxylon crocopeplum]
MLLRQLQRPSIRSVAAAAWRPAATALLHGSSSRPQSSPSHEESQHDHHDDVPQPTNKSPSLFEQLFPDEAKQLDGRASSKSSWMSELFDEFSPLAVPNEDLPTSSDVDSKPDTMALRAKSMLILSAASKHLTESDFLRLGRHGAHVEGWVGGIQRVIQARDPDTLQPLGHYFLLFDSREAAVLYRDEVERLWKLGKTHVPGAHHGRASASMAPLPRGLLVDEDGRDVAAAIQAFTLVPPSQRLDIALSTAHSREQMEGLDLGGGASFVDRLAARTGTRHNVLVAVDGGRISVDTLRQAIEEDGTDRNLAWRVTDLENGILPFGKSVLKRRDGDARDFEQSLLDQAGQAMSRRDRDRDNPAAGREEEGGDGEATATDTMPTDDRKYRRYPRFIVPFTDNAEAQRFVRSWHRRQFKLQMSIEERGEQVVWDETRILNASVLW